MKLTYIFILLIAIIYTASSGKIDSLKSELKEADDNSKIEILYSLAASYEQLNPVERNQYAEMGYKLALESMNDSLIAVGLKNLAIGKYYLQDFDSTTYYFQAALEQYRRNKDTFGIAVCLGNLGMLYKRNIQYDIAIDYMLQSRDLKEAKGDSSGLTNIYYNLISLYYELGDTYKAFEYNKLVEDMNSRLKLPKDYDPDLWINYGAIYLRFGQQQISHIFDKIEYCLEGKNNYNLNDSAVYYLTKAEKNYEKALEYHRKVDNVTKMATILKGIGNLNMTKKDFDKSFKAYFEALDLFQKSNIFREVGRMYSNIAYTYAFKGDLENSVKYYKKADSIASEYNLLDVAHKANEALYKYYLMKDDKVQAFDYLERLHSLRDSTQNLDLKQRLTKLRVQETLRNKNYQIQLLEKDKEVLARERIILVISVSVALILAILLYARYRYKTKTNKLLEKKNIQLGKLNNELKDSQEQLSEINTAKDKMFAIIAHDLRNPIGSFRQTADLLYTEFDSLSEEDKRDFAEGLKDSSLKVYNLMENLLTWSRSQRGKIECNSTETNLFRLVENTKDNLTHQAQVKNVNIYNLINPETDLMIDPQLTSTILRNLISNAIKFSDENSGITIECKMLDECAEISVRDQGVGMNKKQIEKLFDLDSSNSTKGTNGEEGTGLGLLLCKEFAELQGGKIRVESELNKGSTFFVCLPFK